MKLFFDGGYRPAGGMETAVVLRGQAYLQRALGPGSSFDAEWLALIAALRLARACALPDFILLGDALPVVQQANGEVRGRGTAVDHLEAFQALALAGSTPRVRYVKRSQNLAGIALARLHPR